MSLNSQSVRLPRQVSLTLYCQALFQSIEGALGWFCLVFSMMILWMIALQSFAFLQLIGALSQMTGTITAIREIKPAGNGKAVYAVEYSYLLPSRAIPYSGQSYAQGKYSAHGMPVTIEYHTDKPEFSRIQGLTARKNRSILIALIFPVLGFGLVLFTLVRGMNAIKLLREGLLSWGRSSR